MVERRHLFVIGLLTVVLSGCAPDAGPTREITVVARGMSFLIEGESSTNPVIPFRARERVRIQLRNESPGLLHDFVIPAWGVEIDQIRAGESREVTTTVPDTPGRFEYHCRPHSEMMSGFVEVTR